MGARLRALDWSKTAVGPVERWPQSLRTVLALVLESNVPLCLAWGAGFVMFYNDAFASTLGLNTDAAVLGRSAQESQPHIWSELGPRLQDILTRDEPTCQEDMLLLLDRNGHAQETYFTFRLSAVKDEWG
jgi:hypothetical protein